MFKKLLVAYDGSEDSQKALEMALELSRRFDSEVHLLTIIEQLPGTRPPLERWRRPWRRSLRPLKRSRLWFAREPGRKGWKSTVGSCPGMKWRRLSPTPKRGILIPSSWAAKGVRPSCGPRAAAPPFKYRPMPPARLSWCTWKRKKTEERGPLAEVENCGPSLKGYPLFCFRSTFMEQNPFPFVIMVYGHQRPD